MANKTLAALKSRSDGAWENLARQLQGMGAHLDRSDAPGEWTAREVLSHLLFEPGSDPLALLERFATRDLPLVELDPGLTYMTAERRAMTLGQFKDALDARRQRVFAYLESRPEADLTERKARIPLFKIFLGTDEVPIAVFVGAMFDYHWNDHAGQLAKIRKAVGLPPA